MSLVWAILVVAAAAGIAISVMLLVRRQAPEGSYFADGDRASGVFGVIATGFSVLLGFVIFLAFHQHRGKLRHRNVFGANSLGVAEGTIKNHVSNILAKMGVRDRTRAVLKAFELGQI